MRSVPSLSRIYLIMLAILAILTANMYAPGIPLIQADLHTSSHAIQMSISYYMLGLALGMLVYGPFSDHFGRKPVLFVSFLIYIAGTVLSGLSHSIDVFLVSRLMQAVGAAGALALWQAIAVDVYGEQAPKMIAVGYMAIGTIPALSPLVGGDIIAHMGWHSVFFLLGVYGVLVAIATLLFRSRQKIVHADTQRHWMLQSVNRYRSLFASSRFILLAVLTSVMYSQLYVFVAQTPAILHHLGYSTQKIGLAFIPISVSFILGSIVSRLMMHRQVSGRGSMIFGSSLYVLGIMLQIILPHAVHAETAFTVVLPFSIMTVGTGMMLPVIVGRAMRLFSQMAGSSAAFIGATQNLVAFVLSAAAASLSHLLLIGLTVSLTTMGLLTLVLVFITMNYCEG